MSIRIEKKTKRLSGLIDDTYAFTINNEDIGFPAENDKFVIFWSGDNYPTIYDVPLSYVVDKLTVIEILININVINEQDIIKTYHEDEFDLIFTEK